MGHDLRKAVLARSIELFKLDANNRGQAAENSAYVHARGHVRSRTLFFFQTDMAFNEVRLKSDVHF